MQDMLKCKDLNIKVCYIDTDCLIVDKKLPDNWIDNEESGKYKLEEKIKKSVFLAPKAYAYKSIKEKEIIKLKGVEHEKKSKLWKNVGN